ncbi:MAG TPA: c-type cytochrome [Pseudomonadales bacterium]
MKGARIGRLLLWLLAGAAGGALAADAADELLVRGENVYQRCIGCHSLTVHRTGPRHCGLIGRRAGTDPGYQYSPALADSGIVWNAESLDRFLAAPLDRVPGTTMGFAGIADPEDRRAVIEYLQHANREYCNGIGG